LRFVFEHTIAVNAPIDAIWKKLVDWQHWTQWDAGMEKINFDAPLGLGSIGKLKLKGGPEVDLVITRCEEPNRYVDEFELFGSKYIFDHIVFSENGQNKLKVSLHTTGLFSQVFAFLIDASCKTNLPIWMDNFKTQIENKHPTLSCEG
jgi:hypothetical protein